MGRKAYRNETFTRIIKGNPNYTGNNKFRKNGLIAGFETMKDLNTRLGVDRSTITRWESGETFPDVSQLIEISKLFNVSVDYLLGLTESDSLDADIHNATEITGLSTESVEVLRDKIKTFDAERVALNRIIEDKRFESMLSDVAFAIIHSEDTPIKTQPKPLFLCYEPKSGKYDFGSAEFTELYKSYAKEKWSELINDITNEVKGRLEKNAREFENGKH